MIKKGNKRSVKRSKELENGREKKGNDLLVRADREE